jgi:copper chaperone CopZ
VTRNSGVGVETVRFCERKGLVDQPPKPQGGGRRIYTQDSVGRIRLIRQARELGSSLGAGADILAFDPGIAGEKAICSIGVDGLACQFCAYGFEKRLSRIAGVETALTNIESGTVAVTMAEGDVFVAGFQNNRIEKWRPG